MCGPSRENASIGTNSEACSVLEPGLEKWKSIGARQHIKVSVDCFVSCLPKMKNNESVNGDNGRYVNDLICPRRKYQF